MKRKKLFIGILFIFLFIYVSCSYAYNEINVVGQGLTEQDALQDAFKKAVEMTTSTFIFSESEARNYVIVKNKIVKANSGYVKGYEISRKQEQEGLVILDIKVKVDYEAVQSFMHSNDVKAISYESMLHDIEIIKFRQSRLKALEDALNFFKTIPLKDMYSVDFYGFEIKHIGLKEVDVKLNIRFQPNVFYLEAYHKLLALIDNDSVNNEDKDNIKICTDFNASGKGIKRLVHTDLFDYLTFGRKIKYSIPSIDIEGYAYAVENIFFNDLVQRWLPEDEGGIRWLEPLSQPYANCQLEGAFAANAAVYELGLKLSPEQIKNLNGLKVFIINEKGRLPKVKRTHRKETET
ncbi:MAG: hypothetical protein ABSB95_12925 [Dissulfurispiraceae bacterium]